MWVQYCTAGGSFPHHYVIVHEQALIIVNNKTDLQPLEEISKDDVKLAVDMKVEAVKTLIGQGSKPTNYDGLLLTMSTLTEEGVIAVKNAACVRLFDQKVN